MIKPKGLGRGLDVLLGGDDTDVGVKAGRSGVSAPDPSELPLARLQPGRYQPRTRMDEGSLQELAASIARHGVMQPIVVRPLDAADPAAPPRYEIIAGERRFRAALLARLTSVPVVVRVVPDEQALAMALIENIQREDLNPLEQAQAIARLIEEFRYTHEQAAEAIGRSRSATSNLLRLLNLPPTVQTMLLAGDLDMGHARAVLALDRASQIMLANEVVEKRLSVRETEKRVAEMLAAAPSSGTDARVRRGSARDRDLERLQEQLAELLGAPVQLRVNTRGAGRMIVQFGDAEQFEGLLERMHLHDALER